MAMRFQSSYLPLGGSDDHPVQVRTAMHLAPCGYVTLLTAMFLASGASVCTGQCYRQAETRENLLLSCQDNCMSEVRGTKSTTTGSPRDCKEECHTTVGFSLKRVHRQEEACKAECESHPFIRQLASFLAVCALLPTTPLLASYKQACRCECCVGEGCNQRVSFFIIAWVAYTFSCLYSLPTVLEGADIVGGKVLFGLAQGMSMGSMTLSRAAAAKMGRLENGASRVIAGSAPTNSAGMIVGTPVAVESSTAETRELKNQVQQLQHQLKDLVRMQTLQMQATQMQQAAQSSQQPVASSAARPAAPVELDML